MKTLLLPPPCVDVKNGPKRDYCLPILGAFGDISSTNNRDHSVKVFIVAFAVFLSLGIRVLGQGCTSNPIVCENALTGNVGTEWDVGIGDASIQGFATDISVNRGQTVTFKINTIAAAYRIDIYRLGYYAGRGARKVATVNPSVSLPQIQPTCLRDPATGLVDCGNWAASASWVYLRMPPREFTSPN